MSTYVVDLREKSRQKMAVQKNADQKMSMDEVQAGCLLRIADAIEIMCRDKSELEQNAKLSIELANQRLEEIEKLKKQRNAYKGKYEKIKKQLAEMEAKCI